MDIDSENKSYASLNRDRLEYALYKVLDELSSFLSKDGQAVSAVKIAGILGIANMDSYAVKARVEHEIAKIIPTVEQEEGVKITSIREYAALMDRLTQESAARKEANPVKEPVQA